MTAPEHQRPVALALSPIDDRARSGGYQLVFAAGDYACARWAGEDEGWRFAGGAPLDFIPTHFRP